jgi:hypothetical protein
MKHLRMLNIAVGTAMFLTALGAATASATTLEVKGVPQSGGRT